MTGTLRPLALLGFLAAASLALPVFPASASEGSASESTRPFIVKIHADWCGTCTRLEPVWERLEAEYGGLARLVVLDVTDRAAHERSRELATRLGLSGFFDAHKSKTGTVAVLDGRSGRPVQVFKGELDFAAYESALRELGVERSS
jgi:thiol-disulfide isomerase/thioredoxin